MLESLRITDFAIIDEVTIEFNSGMTALTGETGAGKSIIIDAIGQLLGQRASIDMVKSGAKQAFIEGAFDISKSIQIKDKLESFGFEEVEDTIIVSKTITAEGKSTCRLNYRIVNTVILKEIIGSLIDIHSQFDTQYLLNQRIHIDLLDQYAGEEISLLMKEYTAKYNEYQAKKKELKTLLSQPMDEEQLEYLQFQLQEITNAAIEENELDALENEKKQMDEFEKINQTVESIINDLDGQYGSISLLQSAMHSLETLTFLPAFEKIYEQYEDGFYKMQDSYEEIKEYLYHLEFDSYRYQEVQERIFLIHRIQKKYGYSFQKINEYKYQIEQKIEMIENQEEYIEELNKQIAISEKEAKKIALQIEAVRKKVATVLEKEITKQLHDLYMEKAIFKIDIQTLDSLLVKGCNEVNFLISTNLGQELKPLQKIASGGELSRLMLGLKTIFTSTNQLVTVIFDEVDTGVSGKVADSIGLKMKEISKKSQVLCITHLPQVASYASQHLFVYKESNEFNTYTKVKYLNNKERTNEIASMLSGNVISTSSLEAAADLLLLNGNK